MLTNGHNDEGVRTSVFIDNLIISIENTKHTFRNTARTKFPSHSHDLFCQLISYL